MIDPIAIGQPIRYVSKYDTDSNPTIWIVGAIDSMQKSQIQASFVEMVQDSEGKTIVQRNKQLADQDFEIVRHALKGFENFKVDFKTEKMKFFDREIEVASYETLRQIPLTIIRELANVAWAENHVSKELAKN